MKIFNGLIVSGLSSLAFMGTIVPMSPASATTITDLITVTGSVSNNISPFPGSITPPVNPFSVTIKVTFDPALSYGLLPNDPVSLGITLVSTNVEHVLPLSFRFDPSHGGGDLSFGTWWVADDFGDTGIPWGGLQAYLSDVTSGLPKGTGVQYLTTADDGIYDVANPTVSISQVPLPGAVGMFAATLGCLMGLASIQMRGPRPHAV